MAARKALVINSQGLQAELPAGDTLLGVPIGLQILRVDNTLINVPGTYDATIGAYIPVYTVNSSLVKVRAATNAS